MQLAVTAPPGTIGLRESALVIALTFLTPRHQMFRSPVTASANGSTVGRIIDAI